MYLGKQQVPIYWNPKRRRQMDTSSIPSSPLAHVPILSGYWCCLTLNFYFKPSGNVWFLVMASIFTSAGVMFLKLFTIKFLFSFPIIHLHIVNCFVFLTLLTDNTTSFIVVVWSRQLSNPFPREWHLSVRNHS